MSSETTAAVAVQSAIGVAGGIALLLAIAIVAVLVLAMRLAALNRKSGTRIAPTGAVPWTDGDTYSIQSDGAQLTSL